jgi:hypothetical protein
MKSEQVIRKIRGLVAACLVAQGGSQSQTAIAARSDVQVKVSDARAFVVEFRPEYHERRFAAPDGRQLFLLDFDGAVSSGKEGEADLRSRLLPLALPAENGNIVQVLAADYEDISGVEYAPVPHCKDKEGMPVSFSYDRSDVYRQSVLDPAKVAELLPSVRSRSVTIGRVKVTPVQYDAARRVARKYTRILLQVSFGAPAGALASTDDLLLRSAVLNGDVLKTWKAASLLSKAAALIPSVLASGDWYRIPITEEGIYRLDAKFLSSAGIDVSSLDPRTIKIYGNGGMEVPEASEASRTVDLAQNAIYVEGESDGKFDSGDYVLFYGCGTRGVRYDSTSHLYLHYIHDYTEANYYWLTFGGTAGKRMAQVPSLTGQPDIVADSFTDMVAIEEEKVNLLSSGRQWYGQTISGPTGSFTYVNVLQDLVPDQTITYRYSLVAHSDEAPTFTVREGSTVLGTHTLSASYGYLYATGGTYQRSGTSTLANNTSQLNIQMSALSSSQGWIDWVEISFPRRLWAANNVLRFRSPDVSALVEYHLQQFGTMPIILDVTTQDAVKMITGVGGSYTFRRQETLGRPSQYYAAVSAGWKTPAGATKMANQNLRGYADGADFIIVTSTEFMAAAQRLKAHRENPAYGGLKTYIADIAAIYNEFSGGLPDVSALRDYLRYAYDNWTPRPQFVLLLGEGTYDYKGLLGTRSTYVPTWQSVESRDEIYSYTTDDFFVRFGSGNAVSLASGRITSRSVAEANLVIDKIIRYDQESAKDLWKMRMLFVGDDAFTTEGGEVGDRTIHSDDQETLAGSRFTPDEFEKKKIYIAEYPTVNTAVGRRKPAANQAIIDQVNQGVLIFNYAGHGNSDLLAHEHIFEVQTSVPQLTNASRLSVWYLATCGFSQYDDPKAYTGSEFLMNKPDGGAVAVVSATRKVYQGANAALNQGTYQRMFTRDSYGRLIVERPATALFLYKAATGDYDPNDQKFCFMGDPTMRLQYPALFAMIDSINGERVDSVNGLPRTAPVQVQSLSRVSVSGTLRNGQNLVDQSFDGRATVVLNDATRVQVIVNFYPGTNWSYLATGETIYRGDNTVHNGRFHATLVVPKDIAYADSTSRGRLVAYFSGTESDGAAYTSNVRVAGADSTVRNDGKGPDISLYINSRDFRPGDMVSQDPILVVDLRDSNGINTSGSSIGHRLEAWVNGSLQSLDLTGYYASKLDDYRQGSIEYPLKDLSLGRNTLRVRAWDAFDNSSTAETYFEVASADGLTLADVYNYPNPFSESTLFTFRHNQTVPLKVTVKVYSVAGRLIQIIETITNGEPYVRIPWDGRDREGDAIANGVYLYRIVAQTVDGRFSSESLGKLSVLK